MVAVGFTTLGASASAAQEALKPVSCGSVTAVTREVPDEPVPSAEVAIQQGNRTPATVRDQAITAIECVDVTGDSVPELLIQSSSEGAHCCNTLHVLTTGTAPTLLLEYTADIGDEMGADDVAGDGHRELMLWDMSFDYFRDLSFANAPVAPPLVACYADGAFHDCTAKFPAILRDARTARVKELQAAVRDRKNPDWRASAEAAAVGIMAASELLGNERAGLDSIRAATSDAELHAWLADAMPEIRKLVATRSQQIKRRQD